MVSGSCGPLTRAASPELREQALREIHRGQHQVCLLVAQPPAFAGERIEPGDRHPGQPNAEVVRQRLGGEHRGLRDVGHGEQRRHLAERHPRRDQGDAQTAANLHGGALRATPTRPARYSMWLGKGTTGARGPLARDGRGDQSAHLARDDGVGGRSQVVELRAAGDLARLTRLDLVLAEPGDGHHGRTLGQVDADPRRRPRQHALVAVHGHVERGRAASARTMTSGPMPAGHPMETPIRGESHCFSPSYTEALGTPSVCARPPGDQSERRSGARMGSPRK